MKITPLKITGFVVAGIIVLVALCKDPLIAAAASLAVRSTTGATLSFDKFYLDLIGTKIDIKGMRLSSPDGFHGEPMIDIPTVYVDYRMIPLLGGKVIVDDIKFELKEITLVKNEKGTTNFDVVSGKTDKDGNAKKKSDAQSAESDKVNKTKTDDSDKNASRKNVKKEKKELSVEIGSLYLKAEKMTFKDYGKKDKNGKTPDVSEFKFYIEEQQKNITDITAYAAVVTAKIIAQTTLGNVLELGNKLIDGTTGVTKGVVDAGGNAVKKTGEALTKTTKALFGVFGSK
jgi:uncharacterized protein involved in outer membrane biogenesis